MDKIICLHCGSQKEVNNYHFGGDTIKAGYEVVYDMSNGLTMIYLCQHCSDTIRKGVRIIEDILNKPISHVNLMNFSSRSDK